jgi:hypothetical protein
MVFEVTKGEHLQKTIPVDKPDEIFVDISPFIEMKRKAESEGVPIDVSGPEFDRLVAEHTQHTKRVMLSKYSGWNYEKEFRLLLSPAEYSDTI